MSTRTGVDDGVENAEPMVIGDYLTPPHQMERFSTPSSPPKLMLRPSPPMNREPLVTLDSRACRWTTSTADDLPSDAFLLATPSELGLTKDKKRSLSFLFCVDDQSTRKRSQGGDVPAASRMRHEKDEDEEVPDAAEVSFYSADGEEEEEEEEEDPVGIFRPVGHTKDSCLQHDTPTSRQNLGFPFRLKPKFSWETAALSHHQRP